MAGSASADRCKQVDAQVAAWLVNANT